MAVDTANKRYSMIGFGASTPRLLPIPDGALLAADRAILVYLYHGITLGAVAEAVTLAATVYGPNPAATVYGPNPTAILEGS